MALKVLDRAMQAFGAEGICQDQPLAQMFAGLRTLRYADVSFDNLRPSTVARKLQLTFSTFAI
jgi:alkylation response protein AidB-like acyl-CoA dehydrogenase